MSRFELLDSAQRHPAWRLLRYEHAVVVLGFVDVAFLSSGTRTLPVAEAADRLEAYLDSLRGSRGDPQAFPRTASAYLAEWAKPEVGWLRRFLPPGVHEPVVAPTTAAEAALAFTEQLGPREFIGTASRLRTAHDILSRLVASGSPDIQERVKALTRRRDELDQQIAALQQGEAPAVDDLAVREMFTEFVETGRALTRDMRTVEEEFRRLDRRVRSRATTWAGPRGALLEQVFGEQKSIGDSDEGRSWKAFWEYLLSPTATSEMDQMMALLRHIPAVAAQAGEARRMYRQDLFAAAQATQQTVASLSAQLRRFLDDQHFAETRRIDALIRQVLAAGQEHMQAGTRAGVLEAEVPDTRAHISLPLERPLYTPRPPGALDDTPARAGDGADVDLSDMLAASRIDELRLSMALEEQIAADGGRTTLARVVASHPLEEGLEELVAYLGLTTERGRAASDDNDHIAWTEPGTDRRRVATMPRIHLGDDQDSTGSHHVQPDTADANSGEGHEGES